MPSGGLPVGGGVGQRETDFFKTVADGGAGRHNPPMAHEPLSLVCIEPDFPGRLGAVADWLVRRRGWRVRFFCANVEPQACWPPTVSALLL